MSFKRIDRISEELKRELGEAIRTLKDPRIPMMTSIVSARVTSDLRYAKIYVSIMGDKEVKDEAISALKSAAPFLRRSVAGKMMLRYTPELIFELDNSIEYGSHINELLKSVIKGGNDDENNN